MQGQPKKSLFGLPFGLRSAGKGPLSVSSAAPEPSLKELGTPWVGLRFEKKFFCILAESLLCRQGEDVRRLGGMRGCPGGRLDRGKRRAELRSESFRSVDD